MPLVQLVLDSAVTGPLGRRAFLQRLAGALAGAGVGLRTTNAALSASQGAITGCAVTTDPEEWTRFRGPNGTGVAAGKGFPAQLDDPTLLAWKIQMPRGNSSPVLTSRHIFLTGSEKDDRLVLAIDRRDGKRLRTRGINARRSEKLNHRNTPASPSAATDGKVLWRRQVPGSSVTASPTMGEARIFSSGASAEEVPTFAGMLKQYDKDGSGALEWNEIEHDDTETGLPLQNMARYFGRWDAQRAGMVGLFHVTTWTPNGASGLSDSRTVR